MKYEAILFDLDGTLVESASDLIHVINQVLTMYGRPTVDEADMCLYISQGSSKLLEMGFENDFPVDFQQLREDFLVRYRRQSAKTTRCFSAIPELLSAIETINIPWGIVTNKPTAPTAHLVEHLGLDQRASAIVCGDTLPVVKPDPSPLLLACQMLGVNAEHCVYLGDASTDIEAGKLAGMATIACAYGYIHPDNPVTDWHADAVAQTPSDILPLLQGLSDERF